MHRAISAAVGGLTALALAAPAAQAAPDRTLTLTHAAPEATFTSAPASGLNTSFFLDGTATTGACGKTDANRCEETLVFVDSDFLTSPRITFRMEGFSAASDFDLRVYRSNEKGEALEKLGRPESDAVATSPLGSLDPRSTGPGDFETTPLTGVKRGQHYLMQVVYFAVANDKYTGKITLSKTKADPEPAPVAPEKV